MYSGFITRVFFAACFFLLYIYFILLKKYFPKICGFYQICMENLNYLREICRKFKICKNLRLGKIGKYLPFGPKFAKNLRPQIPGVTD